MSLQEVLLPDPTTEKAEPIRLTREEQDSLQVKILTLQNLDLQGKLLHKDLMALSEQVSKSQNELKAESERIYAKYGMTPGKDRIGPDGIFIRGL